MITFRLATPADTPAIARCLADLFGEVELVDGQVSYFDARTQALHEVADVDATLVAPDLSQPADLKGRLV